MAKVYIAAKYARMFELRYVANALKANGHECTSQWLDEGEESKETPAGAAQMDVEDVLRADTILFIGEMQGSKNTGGGRWFELGLAYGAGKRCMVVVGPPAADYNNGGAPGHETVFTSLPLMEVYGSIEAALVRV